LNENIEQIKLKHKIIKNCLAKFPNDEMEKALTIYTVIISYVLPLATIVFCYARMINKIVNKSKGESILEKSKHYRHQSNSCSFAESPHLKSLSLNEHSIAEDNLSIKSHISPKKFIYVNIDSFSFTNLLMIA
jgi:hypothetical protein